MNWEMIVILVVIIITTAMNVYTFVKSSPEQKQEKLEEYKKMVQEWLIWAVAQAEKDLGGGTGQLKLRQVYEMFVVTFPWMVEHIPFEEFSKMVDTALEKFKDLMKKNTKIKDYIEE